MGEFALALAWGLTVLIAFWGWGGVAIGCARDDRAGEEFLEMPGWGMAISVALGGVLNLLGVANRSVLVAYVIIGMMLALIPARALWRRRSDLLSRLKPDRAGQLLIVLAAVLVAVRVAASVTVPSFASGVIHRGEEFNPHDDMHSYLVSLERMLQTGSAGLDPFNSRQIANALGGEHFLNGLTIAPIAVDHVHMLEAGLGLVMLCLASAAMGLRLARARDARSAGVAGSDRSAVIAVTMAMVPLLVDWPIRNLSSLLTGSVTLLLLLTAIHQVFEARRAGTSATRWLWLAAVALAAACSLKSTLIPVACLATALAFVLQALSNRRLRFLGDGMLVGVIAVGLMLPWMIWQYRSSGTLLYPLLGRGSYLDLAKSIPTESMTWDARKTAAFPLVFPALITALMATAFSVSAIRQAAGSALVTLLLAYLIAWMADYLVLLQATDMPDVSRYVASAQVAGLVLLVTTWWRISDALAHRFGMTSARCVRAAGFMALVLWTAPTWRRTYLQKLPENLKASFAGRRMSWDKQTAAVRTMQQAIPAGETLLAYLATPAMLDFQRNRIYVVDWPGESSPPPGMPLRSGSHAIADYLANQRIRYVAYSYAQQANFPRRLYDIYDGARYGRVISRQAAESFAFQDALAELMRTRRKVFDDGLNMVLDLATPANGTPGS